MPPKTRSGDKGREEERAKKLRFIEKVNEEWKDLPEREEENELIHQIDEDENEKEIKALPELVFNPAAEIPLSFLNLTREQLATILFQTQHVFLWGNKGQLFGRIVEKVGIQIPVVMRNIKKITPPVLALKMITAHLKKHKLCKEENDCIKFDSKMLE